MKKLFKVSLALIMLYSIISSSLAAGSTYTTKFNVPINQNNYEELLTQGWTEEDIYYFDANDVDKFLSEAGGKVVLSRDSYYLCKEDGKNIQLSENQAETFANNINNEIMPLEDDEFATSKNDGVCRVSFSVYKHGKFYRSSATVTWLTNSKSNFNSQDILGITHSEGLITVSSDVEATLWYEAPVGANYVSMTKKITDFDHKTGSGAVCSFPRLVDNPQFNFPCRNFRYRLIIDSEINSNNDIRYASIQADFLRGTKKLSVNTSIGITFSQGKVSAGFSIAPKMVNNFAKSIQIDYKALINL